MTSKPLRAGFAALALCSLTAPAWGNYDAARTTNALDLWPGQSSGYNLTGSGVTVGIWEAGTWEILRDP